MISFSERVYKKSYLPKDIVAIILNIKKRLHINFGMQIMERLFSFILCQLEHIYRKIKALFLQDIVIAFLMSSERKGRYYQWRAIIATKKKRN